MHAEQPGYAFFFSLLASSLDGRTPSSLPSGVEDWERVYELACRHAVQGVIYDVLERLPSGSGMPASLAARWIVDVRGIEESGRRMEAVAAKQREAWERHGIGAVLVKGPVTASFYPVPMHRVMGDIDWWMRTPDDWNRALEVLEHNGIQWKADSDGDISYELGGVTVEHHRKGLKAEGPEGVLLMLNEHILHHAMVFGAGMRQLYDYAAALKRLRGSCDMEKYSELLSRYHLVRWTEVLHSALGLAGLAVEADAPHTAGQDARRLLRLVMADGNFGVGRRNRMDGMMMRTALFLRIAPGRFFARLAGLAAGRVRRIF